MDKKKCFSPRANVTQKCLFHNNSINLLFNLPFWVRTGAPEVLVPATDNAVATVDILIHNFFN